MAGRFAVPVAMLAVFVVAFYLGGGVVGFISILPISVAPLVSSTGTPVSPAFWGVSESPSHGFGPIATDLARTPISYQRYPSGIRGEQEDMSTNTLYSYSGGGSPAAGTVQQFVSECRQLACHAIIELPVEIDSPATGAREVSYVEGTLGFTPAYYELGNEPAGYVCWGVAWANWGSACKGGTTPAVFAQAIKAYIASIRAVDASAQFICLGGTGSQGTGPDTTWITAIMAVNGANCAGVSVHVRPASHGTANPTVSDFFSWLQDPAYNLPSNLEAARAAITSACPTCTTRVFVTEFGSATPGSSYWSFVGTWYDVVFEAAQMTQALNAGAYNLDYFAWETGGKEWMYDPGTNSLSPLYYLYSSVFERLGSSVYNSTLGGQNGLYGAATGTSTSSALLLVNTQASTPISVNVAASGFATSANATFYEWTGGTTTPSNSTINDASGAVTLPPMSVDLITTHRGGGGSCVVNCGGGTDGIGPLTLTDELYVLSGVLFLTAFVGIALMPGWTKLSALPLIALGLYYFLSLPQLW